MNENGRPLPETLHRETKLGDLFSRRIRGAVDYQGDPTLADLLKLGPTWLSRAPNIGPHSCEEVHRLMWMLAAEALNVRADRESRLDAIESRLDTLEGVVSP